MTTKQILAAVVLLVLTGPVAMAETKTVYLKGGRQFTGEVTKTAEGYEIKTKAGTISVSAEEVLRIVEVVRPADELANRLAKAGKDPEALYRTALWARDKKLLTESRDLLKKVLLLKPEHENAALVLKLVQMELDRIGSGTTTRPTGTIGKVAIDPSKLLTQDAIYRIRLLELDSKDKVAVEYRNNVLDRFIASMEGRDVFAKRGGERQFRRLPRVRQVRYILRNTDRDNKNIRDDILIKTDPAVMKTFRSRIWPIVQNGCAGPACHGGAKDAGDFRLFSAPMTDDRVAYTNFYILQGWQKKGKEMISRDDPRSSLLLQCGLPKRIAKPGLGHPGEKELTPVPFASQKDRGYAATLKWITSLRSPMLPPGYRISYKIPGMHAKSPPPPPSSPSASPAPPAEPE